MSVRYGLLGLLAERPLHGYDAKSRFESLLGGAWELNAGQVYTTLQRLDRDGLVEPEGDRGDRRRLAYRLTESGQQALQQWLREPESEPQPLHEAIYLKLLLARRLGRSALTELLSAQRQVFLQRIKDLGQLEEGARRQGRQDLVLMYRGAELHAEADLKWIDACWDELEELRRSPEERETNSRGA